MPDQSVMVGEQLRQARLSRGLSLAEMARRTNVRSEHLRSLEMGEIDRWVDSAYSRAFTRAYAAELGIDSPDLVVPGATKNREPAGQDLVLGFGTRPSPENLGRRLARRPGPALLLAVVAVVAVVVALLTTGGGSTGDTEESPEPGAAPGSSQPESVRRSGTPAGPTLEQKFGPMPAVASPTAGGLEVFTEPGLSVCVLAEGEPTKVDGVLPAGARKAIPGSSFELVFPQGFDPGDLEATFDSKAVEFVDTQGPAAALVEGPGQAEVVPLPDLPCG